MKILLLLFIFINISYNYYVYQAKEAIEYLMSQKYDKTKLDEIKINLAKTFEEFYAFNTIMNNPPQPTFNANYHPKINISQEIREINTYNISLYEFQQNLKRIFAKTRDGHTSVSLDKMLNLPNNQLFNPISFYFKKDEKKRLRLYGTVYPDYQFRKYFVNSKEVFNVMNKNRNNYIEKINNMDPIDYIMKFGEEFFNLRNAHGAFAVKMANYNRFNIRDLPFQAVDVTNFSVVYHGGDNFTTDFLLLCDRELIPKNYLRGNKDNFISDAPFNPVKIDEYGIMQFKIDEDIHKNEEVEWNINYNDKFKCKVDDKNKYNIFFVKSFSETVKSIPEYELVVSMCFTLFDENDYKYIFISSFNTGGQVRLSQGLLEQLSPLTTMNMYGRFRITKTLKELSSNITGVSIDTCENVPISHFFEKKNKVFYGEELSDELSAPFLCMEKNVRKNLNFMRDKMKHKRKPTDLIAFTDYYSFSATSIFFKYMQYYGGGITVGYYGIPKKVGIPLDSSMSPSLIASTEYFRSYEPFNQINQKYGIQMQCAYVQTFYKESDKDIPLEFNVEPVDERFEYYDFFYESNLNDFINEADNIFKKYETKCNPKNKRLVLVKEECDGQFENKHTHGGYECGDDGFWSTKCVPSYCDIGYLFDRNKKKCIPDPCDDTEEEVSSQEEEPSNIVEIILIIICCLLFLGILIIGIFIYIKMNKYKIKINNIPMEDEDRMDKNKLII